MSAKTKYKMKQKEKKKREKKLRLQDLFLKTNQKHKLTKIVNKKHII